MLINFPKYRVKPIDKQLKELLLQRSYILGKPELIGSLRELDRKIQELQNGKAKL